MIDQPKTEAEWQAEYDANTLMKAEKIKADKQRLAAAQARAKKMAMEKQEEAKAMNKVAGRSGPGQRTGGASPQAITPKPFEVVRTVRNKGDR